MSKRNKKKLRRLARAQQMSQKPVVQEETTLIQKTPGEAPKSAKEPIEKAVVEDLATVEESKAVKKEVKKILITVFVLVVSVVIVYLVNIKTDFILKLGEWLSKILNINV